MSELHLQDKFLIPFFQDELGSQEVKASTMILLSQRVMN
jgi:type I restriction enzyme, R subunit